MGTIFAGACMVVMFFAFMLFIVALLKDGSEPKRYKTLKRRAETISSENVALREQNKLLKVRLAAAELGLPYPSVVRYDHEHKELLIKVKESIREEYPDINFKDS